MKKTTSKKLTLKKNVAARLDHAQQSRLAGGAEPSIRCTNICLTGDYTGYCSLRCNTFANCE